MKPIVRFVKLCTICNIYCTAQINSNYFIDSYNTIKELLGDILTGEDYKEAIMILDIYNTLAKQKIEVENTEIALDKLKDDIFKMGCDCKTKTHKCSRVVMVNKYNKLLDFNIQKRKTAVAFIKSLPNIKTLNYVLDKHSKKYGLDVFNTDNDVFIEEYCEQFSEQLKDENSYHSRILNKFMESCSELCRLNKGKTMNFE